jgi:hypothetical protein
MCIPQYSPDGGLLGGAVAVMGAGALLGLVLALQHDHVTIDVTPMDTALRLPSLARREAGWFAAESTTPYGLGVRARF